MLFNFRFDELFRTKEKWSLEEISPYIRYVITEAGFNLNFVFNFPFCNCFCVKNSIKLSSFLLFQIWIVWWMFKKIWLSTIFYLYFVVDCKSYGEMLRTLRKLLTCGRSLTNLITWNCIKNTCTWMGIMFSNTAICTEYMCIP